MWLHFQMALLSEEKLPECDLPQLETRLQCVSAHVLHHNQHHLVTIIMTNNDNNNDNNRWKQLGEIECLALVIACLCHDLDHRGERKKICHFIIINIVSISWFQGPTTVTKSSPATAWPACTLPQRWSITTLTSASCSSTQTATSSWQMCQRWWTRTRKITKYCSFSPFW